MAGTGWRSACHKLVEGSATAFGSILVLGLAGYSYHLYYKSHVLRKMENAFAVGYSSVEMAALSRHLDAASPHSDLSMVDFEKNDWVPRAEQAIIDSIVDGTIKGQYHLITGEKGTGKTSMLLKAMRRIGGEGTAMLEAHGDPEIFRVRLGKHSTLNSTKTTSEVCLASRGHATRRLCSTSSVPLIRWRRLR